MCMQGCHKLFLALRLKIDVGPAPTGRIKHTWLIIDPPKGAQDLCIPRVKLNELVIN